MKKLYTATRTVHYEEYYLIEVEVGEEDTDESDVEFALTGAIRDEAVASYENKTLHSDEEVDLEAISEEEAIQIEKEHTITRQLYRYEE